MEEVKELEIDIAVKGMAIVDCGYIDHESGDIVAARIDLKSKYCEAGPTVEDNGVPGIFIDTSEFSIKLNNDSAEDTLVMFPGLAGYDIWSASLHRYSLRVCFVRSKQEKK